MLIKKIEVRTKKREEMVNITPEIRKVVSYLKQKEGKITVFIPHTTAAVTINENADPDVPRDIIFALNKISPNLPDFHHLEGNSDAHIKSSLIGNTQDIFFQNNELLLGIWQDVFFCEFDGPRNRKALIIIQEI